MASRDYTYCTRECEEMKCKHNKKHLDDMDVVTAISWYNYPECEKGRTEFSQRCTEFTIMNEII